MEEWADELGLCLANIGKKNTLDVPERGTRLSILYGPPWHYRGDFGAERCVMRRLSLITYTLPSALNRMVRLGPTPVREAHVEDLGPAWTYLWPKLCVDTFMAHVETSGALPIGEQNGSEIDGEAERLRDVMWKVCDASVPRRRSVERCTGGQGRSWP